jgi:hypothetical protein
MVKIYGRCEFRTLLREKLVEFGPELQTSAFVYIVRDRRDAKQLDLQRLPPFPLHT